MIDSPKQPSEMAGFKAWIKTMKCDEDKEGGKDAY